MKKVIALIMVLMMVVTLLPVSAFADTTPTFSIESNWAMPGSTVNVNVSIENNPGLITANLEFILPDGIAVVGATAGDAFSALKMELPQKIKNGEEVTGSCRIAWYSGDIEEEDIKDGVIITLKVKLPEDAKLDDVLNIGMVSSIDDPCIGKDGNPVSVNVSDGSITVIDYIPGDVDQNGKVNLMDVVTLVRYIVDGCTTDPEGYNISLKREAADVDSNGKITLLDVVKIVRYIVDGCQTDPLGYNIKLLPAYKPCEHANMERYDAKAATCTEDGNIEYWYCAKCDKYFTDAAGNGRIALSDTVLTALGHDEKEVAEVPATTTSEGYTAGIWCERCEKWLSGHEVIEPIEENEANITYRFWYVKETTDGITEIVADQYLRQQQINNTPPNTYVEGEGIADLSEPETAGYVFLGWYEKPEVGAARVYSIDSDSKGDKILYGIWRKNIYTITYLPDAAGSIVPKVAEDTYTVDKETALQFPVWKNLIWVGWSDEDGNIVKSIPKGTSGNISLTANWMSVRNQTVPKSDYASQTPAFFADEDEGIYTFTYEIGDIQNVPVQVVDAGTEGKGFNLVKGQTHEIKKTFTKEIGENEAVNVANIIANATVRSDSWSLSNSWNKSSSFSKEHSNEVSSEQTEKVTKAFENSNKYSLGSGFGGSHDVTDENGNSHKVSSKHDIGVSANIGVEAEIKAKYTALTPFKKGKVNANLGIDYNYTHDETDEENSKHTDTVSTNWNTSKGFESSAKLSQSNEFSQSLSQSIRDTFRYEEVLDFGSSTSETVSSTNSSSNTREYSSSVTYSTTTGEQLEVSETITADADSGWYRKVLAANFKVFAVVIYDAKTSTFSTMTYSLKYKDSEHLFTDYSGVSSFNDYENGVLPFEVPEYVKEYVYSVVGKSEGLQIDDETGIVDSYGYKDPATGICYKSYDKDTGVYSDPCDTDVVIPQCIVVNGSSGTKRIVPVTGIAPTAFSGTTVTSVYLNNGITSIPDGAFENCKELKYVTGGEITSIGSRAFKNCPSLGKLLLSDIVTNMGEQAFYGDEALEIVASTPAVVDSAISSGVKSLKLDLSKLNGSLDNKTIETPDTMSYLEIDGGEKTYKNLKIVSNAETTKINYITIDSNSGIPLELSSENVELGFSTIKSSGLAMSLKADTTDITLDGNNYLISGSDNAVLSKGLSFYKKLGSTASGKLKITGNALVCGTVSGDSLVSFDSDKHGFKYLTSDEYDKYMTSCMVYFEPNGGDCSQKFKEVLMGTAMGELPVPAKEYYTFEGWFTEAEGGDRVDEETVLDAVGETTLYAHWTLNPLSDWTLASEVPDDGKVENTKWNYTLREYTTNSAATLTGWTKYDTKRTSWGAWSGWSTTNPTNGVRNVESRSVYDHTEYHYYRWYNGTSVYTHQYNSGYWLEEKWFTYILPTTSQFSSIGYVGSDTTKNWWVRADYEGNRSVSTTFSKSVNRTEWRYQDPVYTYYYYRDVEKEATADPTGQENVSNVVMYVQYRAK